MRRMLQIVGWLGMGLSAVLFVATIVLWVRSVGHEEEWRFIRFELDRKWNAEAWIGSGTEHWFYARVARGKLWLRGGVREPWRGASPGFRHWRREIPGEAAAQEFVRAFRSGDREWQGGVARARQCAGAGIWYGRTPIAPRPGRPRIESFVLALPFWMPTVLFGLWPTLFILRRVLRRKRYGPGMCPNCGYDLRATPRRCPECGREVVGKGE